MKKIFLLIAVIFISNIITAQNVGVGTTTPNEKLNVDSGNVRIGKDVWQSATNSKFLKLGDADYITLGEEEADDKLTIRARELFIRPSATYTAVPVSIKGTSYFSHFFFGTNEDTYIRGGKNTSNVNIADLGGRVGIGISNPTRAGLEQNGAVGNTAAIFGGEGAGISLQRNFPAIGFNHYSDAAGHKSIGQGYGAQLGLNQTNGTLYLASFPFVSSANQLYPSFNQRLFISRFGKVGIGADNPYADLEINHRDMSSIDEDVDAGITYKTPLGLGWNTHIGRGAIGNFSNEDSYSFWYNIVGSWIVKAAINRDGGYWQASDKELKKNINYLQNRNTLEKIMLLKPASYNFKEQENNHPLNYGFIAQDLEKVFPEMVMQMKTNKLVSYSSLIPILTKGIQEQQQQIEALQKENENIKKELQELKKLILTKN
jgi:hypothetical protein